MAGIGPAGLYLTETLRGRIRANLLVAMREAGAHRADADLADEGRDDMNAQRSAYLAFQQQLQNYGVEELAVALPLHAAARGAFMAGYRGRIADARNRTRDRVRTS